MGSQQSSNKKPGSQAKPGVPVKVDCSERTRGRSYLLHSSKRPHSDDGDSTAQRVNGVACMIRCRAARNEVCGTCSTDIALIKDIFTSHRGISLTSIDISNHICTRCNSVLCLECGSLLNDVLAALTPEELRQCTGCRAWRRSTTPTDMSASSRKHQFCPNCHPLLRERFAEPFRKLVERLMTTIEFAFSNDSQSSFVLVDVKALPEEQKLAILEEAAQPTPLLPIEARARLIEHLTSNLAEVLDEKEGRERSADEAFEVASKWFTLGEKLNNLERVDIAQHVRVNKVDCYIRAVQHCPTQILFLSALLYNMSKRHVVQLADGATCMRAQIAERIVRLIPDSPEAWRNAAFVMDVSDRLTVGSESFTRNECLQRSIDLNPTDHTGWYTAAATLCPHSALLRIDGELMDRRRIYSLMLDDTKDADEGLEELVRRFFGENFVVFLCSEMSLLCPDHPRIVRHAANFHVAQNNLVGMGAFGQVYQGEFNNGSKKIPVAAKVMTTQLQNSTFQSVPELYMMMSPVFAEVVTRAYFIRFDAQRSRTTVFMEYAVNGSAFRYMKNLYKSRLHESTLRMMLFELLNSLRVLHYHGVVHQDIKPPNILVFEDKSVKLADFGVTCLTYCDLCELQAAGTEVYMPPEAYNDGTVATPGDIWSLAASIVELASFNHPVPDPAFVRAPGARHPFRPYIPKHLSTELKEILASMLEYDPKLRPSAADLTENPYFASTVLPSSAETAEDYEKNRRDSGIPQRVRDMEELSTMGIDTIRTQGTMALTTMRLAKTQLRGNPQQPAGPPPSFPVDGKSAGGANEPLQQDTTLNSANDDDFPTVSPATPKDAV